MTSSVPAGSDQCTSQKSASVRVGYIISSWHDDLLAKCEEAFLSDLERAGVDRARVVRIEAPGALEAPLLAKRMAQTGRFDAIAVIALVVDGGIYRHDFVAQAVVDGIVRVSLDTNVPVLSASLTPHHFHESATHEGFFSDHLKVKGRELASAVLRVRRALADIERLGEPTSVSSSAC